MSARFLTERSLRSATRRLTAQDSDLAAIVSVYGPPPLWAREPGFPTLIHIILEQQVSLASARAAYHRLVSATGQLAPERFLALRDEELKSIGFSRQKTAYGRGLAEAILDGRLDLALIETLDDSEAKARLIAVKGIGSWTADIYLMMGLRRPDTWPNGDLALAVAVQRVKRLRKRPTPERLQKIGEAWRPWRAVAARILWHYYLSSPRRNAALHRQSLLRLLSPPSDNDSVAASRPSLPSDRSTSRSVPSPSTPAHCSVFLRPAPRSLTNPEHALWSNNPPVGLPTPRHPVGAGDFLARHGHRCPGGRRASALRPAHDYPHPAARSGVDPDGAGQRCGAPSGAAAAPVWLLPPEIALPAVGLRWAVTVRPTAARGIRVLDANPDGLVVAGPVGDPAACRRALRRWLLRQGQVHLPPRLAEVSHGCGLPYTRSTVRLARSRWGSCSRGAAISLNARLLLLPSAVLDYVLVHELCHTREPNHSPAFWHLVARYCPAYPDHRRTLRAAGKELPAWALDPEEHR